MLSSVLLRLLSCQAPLVHKQCTDGGRCCDRARLSMAMQRLLLAQRLLFRLQSRRVGVGLAAAVSAALARVATLSSEPGESRCDVYLQCSSASCPCHL